MKSMILAYLDVNIWTTILEFVVGRMFDKGVWDLIKDENCVRGSELMPQNHTKLEFRLIDALFFHHVDKTFIMEILYTVNTDKRRAVEFGSQFTKKIEQNII